MPLGAYKQYMKAIAFSRCLLPGFIYTRISKELSNLKTSEIQSIKEMFLSAKGALELYNAGQSFLPLEEMQGVFRRCWNKNRRWDRKL